MTETELLRLSAADIRLMRAMNAMFAEAFGDPASYASAPPDDAWLSGLLARDHVYALAAIIDGRLAGGLIAYRLDKFEQARSEIYIYDLAVAEPWRRQGIATALIAHLQALAVLAGAWVIFVQGDYGDDPALALYDKLGAREAVLHFDIPVRR